jgi:glutamate-1-semialdehyde 2,1-aminomutase
MITVFFCKGPVHNFAEAAASDANRFSRFHASLLDSGIYWPPSRFEAAFLSAAHTEDDVDRTVETARAVA